jgi:hypothetical protein
VRGATGWGDRRVGHDSPETLNQLARHINKLCPTTYRSASIVGIMIVLRVFLVIVAIAGFIDASVATAQSFSLTISTPHPNIRVRDPLRIDLVPVNIADHGIWIPPVTLDARCDYRIQVEGKTGLTTSEQGCDGSHIIGFSPLKPGGSIVAHIPLTRVIDVTTIFDFSVPGDYVVQLSRSDPDNARNDYVKSNRITIKVLPTNSDPESPPTRQ